MGNKLSNCYILDDFNKKHNFYQFDMKIYQNQVFFFYQTKKPFYSKEIQLFIYSKSKKNNTLNYLLNLDLELENLNLIENAKTKYYEFIEETPEYKISIRLDLNKKIKQILFKIDSKDLYKLD